MKNILKEILMQKRAELSGLASPAFRRSKPVKQVLPFLIKSPLICEIKKFSPSAGAINPGADVQRQAKVYARAGAGAISVLTDKEYFGGSFDDLHCVAKSVDIPVLCKDFIISEVQVENAYLAGADMILLIAAALSKEEMSRLSRLAGKKGLSILYEIHKKEEISKIKNLNPEFVGVNARNLKNMSIDRAKSARILRELKGDFLKVAESGISDTDDICYFKKAGADAFLVGTALMKEKNPAGKIREMRQAVKKCL